MQLYPLESRYSFSWFLYCSRQTEILIPLLYLTQLISPPQTSSTSLAGMLGDGGPKLSSAPKSSANKIAHLGSHRTCSVPGPIQAGRQEVTPCPYTLLYQCCYFCSVRIPVSPRYFYYQNKSCLELLLGSVGKCWAGLSTFFSPPYSYAPVIIEILLLLVSFP